MHNNFGAWFRSIKYENDDEFLHSRWDAITDFLASKYTYADILNLILLFFNFDVKDEFLSKYLSFFLKKDAAFNQDNKIEISLLAGATLLVILDSDNGEYDNIILLGAKGISFIKSACIPSLFEELMNIFSQKRIELREDKEKHFINIKFPNLKSLKDFLNIESPVFDKNFAKCFSEYIVSLNSALLNISNELTEINSENILYREDSQILWWLVCKWSTILNKPYTESEFNVSAIYAGKELADLIYVLPGPYAADAILYQMINSCTMGEQAFSLIEVVNNLKKEFRQRLADEYTNGLDVFFPITYAIVCSTKIDENDTAWVQLYKHAIDDPNNIKIDAYQAASQMYIESLFLKALNRGDANG
jgi:hypothetical protein